jgi:peptidoglycan/LPS O-acetylase OafA/YrhL
LFTAIEYIIANTVLLPGVFPIQPIITVSWSLSFEVLFYLVAPALSVLAWKRYSNPVRLAILSALFLTIILLSPLGGNHIRSAELVNDFETPGGVN